MTKKIDENWPSSCFALASLAFFSFCRRYVVISGFDECEVSIRKSVVISGNSNFCIVPCYFS